MEAAVVPRLEGGVSDIGGLGGGCMVRYRYFDVYIVCVRHVANFRVVSDVCLCFRLWICCSRPWRRGDEGGIRSGLFCLRTGRVTGLRAGDEEAIQA